MIVAIIIALAIVASTFLDKKFPDAEILPKYKEIYIDEIKFDRVDLLQGDTAIATISVYNNSDADQKVIAGLFLLEKSKNYDGVNVDYASQKQYKTLEPKSKVVLNYRIPINIDEGNYKALIWLHKTENQIETVVEDKWYQRGITVNANKNFNQIVGEDPYQLEGIVLGSISIGPKVLATGAAISIKDKITNYSSKPVKLATGVYLLNKNKYYGRDEIDMILDKQTFELAPEENKFIDYNVPISLASGKYRILLWIHQFKDNKEEVILDYWVPGNIEITDAI